MNDCLLAPTEQMEEKHASLTTAGVLKAIDNAEFAGMYVEGAEM